MFAMAIDPRAEALGKLMDENNISFRDLAKRAGIENWQNIRNWVKEGIRPRDGKELDKALETAQEIAEKKPKRVSPLPMGPLRIVGNVAAGDGTYNVDNELDMLLVPLSLCGEDRLGWTVEGDSMMPVLEPGDIAVFREYRQPKNGYIYLAKTKDDGLVCKQIRWNRTTNVWELLSVNASYGQVPMEGVELLGYLVGYYRVRGYHEKFESDPDGLKLDIFN
jgi:SOS-response transcriptional repressor LexA